MFSRAEKGVVRSIVIAIIVLVVVFLSQSPYMRPFGKTLYTQGAKEGGLVQKKAAAWFSANVYPRVSGGVTQGQQELAKQKNNFLTSLWGRVENYFAEKFSKTFGTKVK